jgi:hypothetical protein
VLESSLTIRVVGKLQMKGTIRRKTAAQKNPAS